MATGVHAGGPRFESRSGQIFFSFFFQIFAIELQSTVGASLDQIIALDVTACLYTMSLFLSHSQSQITQKIDHFQELYISPLNASSVADMYDCFLCTCTFCTKWYLHTWYLLKTF